MFGLEKQQNHTFEFDLEKELKSGQKKEAILVMCKERMHKLKKTLREGKTSQCFDQYAIIFQGYSALEKIIKKILT